MLGQQGWRNTVACRTGLRSVASNVRPTDAVRPLQRRPWLVALALLFCVLSAEAKKVALVVGNQRYSERPLRNPANDAALMERTLRSIGFEVAKIVDADRRSILAALRTFEQAARDADVAVFYFAGHGIQLSGNNYLIPINAQLAVESDLIDEAIPGESVLQRLEASRARVALVILDACRDNPFLSLSRSMTRGLARMNAPAGSIIAYSTSSGAVADDGAGANGVYTEQLARYLAQPGLDIKEVFERTAIEVERLTKGKQRPREDIGLRGRFELVKGVPKDEAAVVSIESRRRELDAWALALRSNRREDYREFIRAYPSSDLAQDAREALVRLDSLGTQPVEPLELDTTTPATGFAFLGQLNGTLAKIKESGAVSMGVRESSGALSHTLGGGKYAGFHVELCQRVLADVQKSLGMAKLDIKYQPVTSQNRISLLQNGIIDIECGSTTNTVARQKDVSFAITTYVEEVRIAVKANSGISSIAQLNGKSVATTTGTTSMQHLRRHERAANVNFYEVFGKDHADSFALLESGRADAFVMDAQILAGNIARSRNPSEYRIVGEVLFEEPIALMMRKGDAGFKRVVDASLAAMMRSGAIAEVYERWLIRPMPVTSFRIGLPASASTLRAWAQPGDAPLESYARR